MGTLYLVATPIGNLDDISPRAIRVLNDVDLIAAEDTRVTGVLLSHYGIKTRVTSYYEHNKLSKVKQILAALEQGNVALVSDAGTPVLNDPGYELVLVALEAGHDVRPIPGPSAPIAALVASGLPADAFLYLGYLPRKKSGRRRLLGEVQHLGYTLVFLEAPHRILASMEDMQDILGDRQVGVARELTKMHEEIFRGKLSAALAYFTEKSPRGEFTLVVAGYEGSQERWTEERLLKEIQDSLSRSELPSKIARQLSDRSGWPRREVYNRIVDIQSQPEG